MDHRVCTYYQTIYSNGVYVSPLPLLTLVTHIFLAAFHVNSDRSIHLNDNVPTDPMFTQMWSELGQMQASGVKVLGMLGGAAPGTYSLLGSNFSSYYPPLRDYIAEFHLDGMDLDVEQSTPISVIEQLITQLKSDFGSDFIITLAPVASALTEGGNLSGFDYIQLEAAMGSQIGWYNAQFYSGFGSISPDTGYIRIINFMKIAPSKLVAGVLTSPANGGGYVSTDAVVSSLKMLRAMYPDFGGVNGGDYSWEYFNSLPNASQPWQWAQAMFNAVRGTQLEGANPIPVSPRKSRIYAAAN
ncbi:Endo-beta-N-acetylglucosaminidase [Mycena indigotica]|uniref:chitinase n=1 Tax=Mycena indigotica TaxID=2126181 RepID=A0A8H6TAD7_9AGAR|nr:Endo-beta-N-acetylglucosaminidase [Mycena indigotica]KAF7315125.1 Endo-beta-N-acetylglucosaminidase [Mycena indigotica]